MCNELLVDVCPVSGSRKEEMVEHFHKEEEKYGKEQIYPFSKYAAQNYPDVCIGNCDKCDKWEQRTEKDLYIRDNDTFINHVIYEAVTFFALFFFSLPITVIIGYIAFKNLTGGFMLSLAIAMVGRFFENMFEISPWSFEAWLGERFDAKNTKAISSDKEKEGI